MAEIKAKITVKEAPESVGGDCVFRGCGDGRGCAGGNVSGGHGGDGGDGIGCRRGMDGSLARERGAAHPITERLSINWSFNAAQQTRRQLDATPNEEWVFATLTRGTPYPEMDLDSHL